MAEDQQRSATRIALSAMGDHGFALAGSGALREHGLLNRRSKDVDLFTTMQHAEQFGPAVDAGLNALDRNGYGISELRRADGLAQYQITAPDQQQFKLDAGLDWRAHDPVHTDVGPVLDERDAVSSKVDAVYGRTEPKDIFDLDAIRNSGRYDTGQLMDLAKSRDPGFEPEMFGRILSSVEGMSNGDMVLRGVSEQSFAATKLRMQRWGGELAAGRGQHGAAVDLARLGQQQSGRTVQQPGLAVAGAAGRAGQHYPGQQYPGQQRPQQQGGRDH